MSQSIPTPDEATVASASSEPMVTTVEPTPDSPAPTEPPPSYVKLAMRNMVRKGGKSLFHFALTTVGLVALLVGLAYLTR